MFDASEREGVTALSEFDPHRLCRRCGTMLDGEGEIIAVAAQVEVGVTPGVELGGAAQRLTGADAATTLFGVMDDEHRNVMPALQLAQVPTPLPRFRPIDPTKLRGSEFCLPNADDALQYAPN